MCANKTDHFRL